MAGSLFKSSRSVDPSDLTRSGIRVVNYVVVLIALTVLLIYAQIVLLAVLIGLGIGVILAPCLQLMQRKMHIPRSLAAVLVAVLGMALVFVIGWSIFSVVESQITQLVERAPALIERLQAQLQSLLSRYPWLQQGAAAMNVGASAGDIGAALFKRAWSGVGVFSALLFAIVIGLYVAVEARDYRDGAVRAFPRTYRAAADQFLQQASDTIRVWFRAQAIDMAIVGVLTSLGLWIVGAEYWLLLGLLTGLLGIIPYIGNALVLVFAALITLGSDPSRLPWVLVVFIAVQQLEGNLILPMVMKGGARLPAAPLLVFMLLMGTWAGLLGVLIAPPLFAVICLAYRELYLPRVDDVVTNEEVEAEVR